MDLVQPGVSSRWTELHDTMLNYLQEYVERIRSIGEVDDIARGVVTLGTVRCTLLSYLMSLCPVACGDGRSQEIARFASLVVSWLTATLSTHTATRDH